MLEMVINNVEVGSKKDRVHIVTFCEPKRFSSSLSPPPPPITPASRAQNASFKVFNIDSQIITEKITKPFH